MRRWSQERRHRCVRTININNNNGINWETIVIRSSSSSSNGGGGGDGGGGDGGDGDGGDGGTVVIVEVAVIMLGV